MLPNSRMRIGRWIGWSLTILILYFLSTGPARYVCERYEVEIEGNLYLYRAAMLSSWPQRRLCGSRFCEETSIGRMYPRYVY